MKHLLTAIVLMMSLSTFSQQMSNEEINGKWVIDLRLEPDAREYLKNFIIEIKEGGTITGEFYDTPFENGKVNTTWPRVYFAFRTNDKNSSYFHSGYFDEGEVQGMTYSPERNFIMPWRGSKSAD